jgi:hypothetical protein
VRRIFEGARARTLLYSGINTSTLSGEMLSIQSVIRSGLQICNRPTCSADDLVIELEKTKESIYRNIHLAPLLDCLNQMGNVNFLRRQRSISRQGISANALPEIRSTYLDYFNSVQEALARIEKALWQIEANLCA